mmetsp:Transcript_34418/g.76471  ORF Transcript_34418/g.76471 Transcript_34418/m.76471 type:complete len:214 (+) Transcript_34418:298-939(+)
MQWCGVIAVQLYLSLVADRQRGVVVVVRLLQVLQGEHLVILGQGGDRQVATSRHAAVAACAALPKRPSSTAAGACCAAGSPTPAEVEEAESRGCRGALEAGVAEVGEGVLQGAKGPLPVRAVRLAKWGGGSGLVCLTRLHGLVCVAQSHLPQFPPSCPRAAIPCAHPHQHHDCQRTHDDCSESYTCQALLLLPAAAPPSVQGGRGVWGRPGRC